MKLETILAFSRAVFLSERSVGDREVTVPDQEEDLVRGILEFCHPLKESRRGKSRRNASVIRNKNDRGANAKVLLFSFVFFFTFLLRLSPRSRLSMWL